jgi:hypothetical protein
LQSSRGDGPGKAGAGWLKGRARHEPWPRGDAHLHIRSAFPSDGAPHVRRRQPWAVRLIPFHRFAESAPAKRCKIVCQRRRQPVLNPPFPAPNPLHVDSVTMDSNRPVRVRLGRRARGIAATKCLHSQRQHTSIQFSSLVACCECSERHFVRAAPPHSPKLRALASHPSRPSPSSASRPATPPRRFLTVSTCFFRRLPFLPPFLAGNAGQEAPGC